MFVCPTWGIHAIHFDFTTSVCVYVTEFNQRSRCNTKLQKQVDELQLELAELKSLIKIMPDGSMVYSSAKDKQELIAGDAQLRIAGKLNVDVNGDVITEFAGGQSSKVDKNQSVTVGQNFRLQVNGNSNYAGAKDVQFVASKNNLISAGDKLTLQAGKASIVLHKNGDITLLGKVIEIKGSQDVVLKGAKIHNN